MSFGNAPQREVKEKLKFTGVGEVEIKAVNPNKAELDVLLGVETDKEPVYIIENQDGSKSTRVTFWCNPVGTTSFHPLTIFLGHEPRTSATGKFQFMNNQLKETWAESEEEVMTKLEGDMGKWFKPCGLRKAHAGEFAIYDLMITLCNLDIVNAEDVQFDNLQTIIDGDMIEIRNIISTYNERSMKENGKPITVKVLFGINDKGYQEIYTGGFANSRSNRFTTLEKKANAEYGAFKANFGGTMDFQEYKGETTPKAEEKKTESGSKYY